MLWAEVGKIELGYYDQLSLFSKIREKAGRKIILLCLTDSW